MGLDNGGMMNIENIKKHKGLHSEEYAEHCSTCFLLGEIERLEAERGNYNDKDALKVMGEQIKALQEQIEHADHVLHHRHDNEWAMSKEIKALQKELKDALSFNRCLNCEALESQNKRMREALADLIKYCTVTYEDQAKKYLKPEFIGKSRVWSDYSCWLYPGDCIFEVDAEALKKAQEALQPLPVEGEKNA